jgi:hypothetical protein
MEKYTIEIETSAGWVLYHSILRPGKEKAASVLLELREQHPESTFRAIKWDGTVVE